MFLEFDRISKNFFQFVIVVAVVRKDSAVEMAKKKEQERQRREKITEASRTSRYRRHSHSSSRSPSPPRYVYCLLTCISLCLPPGEIAFHVSLVCSSAWNISNIFVISSFLTRLLSILSLIIGHRFLCLEALFVFLCIFIQVAYITLSFANIYWIC